MAEHGGGGGAAHPAAEIVAIALRKIRKVANPRKHTKLCEEIDYLLGDLHILIPAAGTGGSKGQSRHARTPSSQQGGRVGSYADIHTVASHGGLPQPTPSGDVAPDAPSETPTPPNRRSMEGQGMVAAASTTTAPPPGLPSNVGEGGGASLEGAAAPPAVAVVAGDGTDGPSQPPPAAADDVGRSAQEAADTPAEMALVADAADGAQAEEAAETAAAEDAASAPAASEQQPEGADGLLPPATPLGSAAAQPQRTVEEELPDLVMRTETALPDPVSDRLLGVLRLAVETQRPEVIEVALDCIQKLVAFRFLQGTVYAVNVDKGDDTGALAPPLRVHTCVRARSGIAHLRACGSAIGMVRKSCPALRRLHAACAWLLHGLHACSW